MKKYIIALLILISGSLLYGESVFLKNGSIFEGDVQKENDKEMSLRISDGTVKQISRGDIIRIQLNSDYKIFKYIYSMDCTYLQGYIVEEKDDNYIIRKKIDSSEEFFIPVKDVNFISNKKIEFPDANEDIFKNWYLNFGVLYTVTPATSVYEYNKSTNTGGMGGVFGGISNGYSSWYHFGFEYSMDYLLCKDDSFQDFMQQHFIATGGFNYILFDRIVIEPVVGLGTTMYGYSEGYGGSIDNTFCFTAMAGLNIPVRFYRGNCVIFSFKYIYPFDKFDQIKGVSYLSAGFSF